MQNGARVKQAQSIPIKLLRCRQNLKHMHARSGRMQVEIKCISIFLPAIAVHENIDLMLYRIDITKAGVSIWRAKILW
jgi:hypothetical protein